MGNESDEQWGKRLFNQRYELIGSTVPGDGNGFHDRISFDMRHNVHSRRDERYDHWLYIVYFRDLLNSFDPQLRGRVNPGLDYELINCTENYANTIKKYIAGRGYHYRSEILDFLSHLSKWLINDGKVILEFVSWFDNDDRTFYAFELKKLPLRNVKERRRFILYEGEDESGTLKKVKIPKEKCIVINWPRELGGYKSYTNTVEKILKLGAKLPSIEDTISLEPGKILARGKRWDESFNRYVSPWGMLHPDKDLTEFYKEYNYLKIRKTGILCMSSLHDGLDQVVRKLNTALQENASIVEKSDYYSITKHTKINTQWMQGEISFPTANEYLK